MNKALKRDLLVFISIFGVLTLPFLFFDLDIILQKPYYNTVNGWFLMAMPFWDFVYKYSIFLGYFVAVFALVLVSVSYWKRNLIKWRKAAYFMLLVIVLGPGVLVNATFKDHWGRPRPREITEFDGKEDFVKVWVIGDTKGKSFPCGHASIAFYLAIPFLFLRKKYKRWAWAFLIGGTLYGLLVGYARMIAGGHFASDVLWASGLVWLTGIFCFYWLKVDKDIDMSAIDEAAQKRKGKIVTIIMGMVLPILTVGLLLATPYISNREFKVERADLNEIGIENLDVKISEGTVNVDFANDFNVKYSVSAFGFPNSKIRWNWVEADTSTFEFEYMGWFTEVRNDISIEFPTKTSWSNSLLVEEGNVFMKLPSDTISKNLNLTIVKGDLMIDIQPGAKVNIQSENNQLKEFQDIAASFDLNIMLHKGQIVIQE
ncbi:MAG: phosphatase PAP2 family protein [Salinivirgaceae bacterium]|jgi:lipid A 4'-phosphatase|nr:phosphatase PAP2 family protein [Salinivirgaceae bacterium]